MNNNLLVGVGIAGVLGAGTSAVVANVDATPLPTNPSSGTLNEVAVATEGQTAAPGASFGEILMGEIISAITGEPVVGDPGQTKVLADGTIVTGSSVLTDGMGLITSGTGASTATVEGTSAGSVYSEALPSSGSATGTTSTAAVDATTSGSSYSEPAPVRTTSSATTVAQATATTSASADGSSSGSSYSGGGDDDHDDDHDDDDHDDDDHDDDDHGDDDDD